MQPDRTACGAKRHGDMSAYTWWGCRCPDAREANRIFRKRIREGRHRPAMVPAVGTARRIQALVAAGWSFTALGRELDRTLTRVRQLAFQSSPHVTRATAQQVRELAHRLAGLDGGSKYARTVAARYGWVSLYAWDDIDDPDAEPVVDASCDVRVDEIAVERAAGGDRTVRLTQVERDAAIRLMRQRGVTLHQISQTLGVQHKIIVRVLAQGMEARDAA